MAGQLGDSGLEREATRPAQAAGRGASAYPQLNKLEPSPVTDETTSKIRPQLGGLALSSSLASEAWSSGNLNSVTNQLSDFGQAT
ncbi:unnamed protein product [Rangifer tarandus platyrhynchus]|uniref:Uncharacterized protein n=1 Tax=Rangifer tarandus platyrhynchus TaxID=3082113 RepID=A0AC59Z9X1_RANTA